MYIRLPKKVVGQAQLKLGQSMAVELHGNVITLTPVEDSGCRLLPSLAQLMDGVTPAKVGGEYSWDQDRGPELLGDLGAVD